jgi:peptide deformylase
VFINPKIVKVFGEKTRPMMVFDDNKKETFFEGCLSFPDLFGTVKRYLKIEAVWDEIIDGQLEPQKEILEGIESIAYQHELDHLDGILFIDRVKEEKGELYEYVEDKKRKVDVEELVKLEG